MRTPLTLTFVCAASLIVACAEDGGSDISPRSGTWDFYGSAPTDDTCGYPDLYTDPPGNFELENNGGGSFTVTADENVFNCTIDGANFSCPERLYGENDVGAAAGLDAVVHYTVSVTGSFSSDSELSGRQLYELVCEGADCATVEAAVMVTTPCGWAQDFTASIN